MRSLPMVAVISAALVAPGAATASTVSMEGSTAVFLSGAQASDVVLDTRVTGDVAFTDAAQALTAGTGCLAGTPVVCPNSFAQTFRLGAGNDRVFAWSDWSVNVFAAAGDDHIDASGGFTHVEAGKGDDHVVAGSNGMAEVIAGDGNDAVRSDVGSSSSLDGNGGDDLIVAVTPFRNDITGGDGNDDVIVMPRSPSAFGGGGFGSITTGAGDDAIIVRNKNNFAGYEIDAGADIDTIYGGSGADVIKAGSGNDLIDVFGDHHAVPGGVVDTVNCGPGADTVFADPEDVIAANCEWVEYHAIPRPWAADRALVHLAAAFPELTPPAL